MGLWPGRCVWTGAPRERGGFNWGFGTSSAVRPELVEGQLASIGALRQAQCERNGERAAVLLQPLSNLRHPELVSGSPSALHNLTGS